MKEELQKIVSGINLDVSPILSAIARIPITNLSDISLGITVIQ